MPVKLVRRLALPALALALSACGDDPADPSVDAGDTSVDATADATADAQLDAPLDAPRDTQDDVGADATDTGEDTDTTVEACENVALPAPDPIDTAQTRFALTMFHFNVEYVIGGLEYFDEVLDRMVLFLNLELNRGWDNDDVEDYIIVETILPMLEMYEQHPEWRATFEMQAYAVEVMAERHPDVLALMRTLAQRGQIELVSFHYAAQLFLAYPREDQERSLARTREVFEEHCLPLSDVVFNQEGQAGEGRQQLLVDEGWRIGVQPRNLWRYVRDGETPWPYYASEGGVLVVGPGGVDPESGIEVTWPFFDDGELRAVAEGINPYAAAIGPHVPARVAEFEANLQTLEDEGWKHTSITDYVHQLEGAGVDMPDAPPLLDGTWQPPSTDSIHRWLGGRSQVNASHEEDNRVRSGNATARLHTDATQVLVDAAKTMGTEDPAWDAEMAEIWTQLWHAQVSDASGVNPWRGEVLWCLALNDEVLERAEAVRAAVLAELGWEHVQVNLAERSAAQIEGVPLPEPPDAIDAWFDVPVRADGREVTVEWFAGPGDNRAVIHVTVAGSEGCDECDERRVEVAFPRTTDNIAYSPGLIEDAVRTYPISDFTFLNDEVYLPLANGLIGIGEDLWLIKNVRTAHIAARISPADDMIRFIDAAIHEDTDNTWVFEVVRGSAEEALSTATGINIDPVVFY